MKAIVWTRYGPPDVLQLKEVEKPTPKDNEVLVKIHATTVTAGDCEMRSLKFHPIFSIPMRIYVGLIRPKRITIPGQELAGEVEAVGKGVKRFRQGDQVFGTTGFSFGAYAEYKCLHEDGLVTIKPVNMTYEEAAAVPLGGLEALHFLRLGNLQNGQKILVNGAGGSIGTIAIQLAKHFGAEVTAVDSTGKLDMLRSIGADHVIDYTKEDFTRNRQRYDLILAVNGYHPLSAYRRALNSRGIYICAGGTLPQIFQGMLLGPLVSRIGSKKMGFMGIAKTNQKDLVFMGELLEAGKVVPVIERYYPLSEVAVAIRYLAEGHARGKVVITLEGNNKT